MERNRHASIISTNLLSLSIEVGQITSDSGLVSLGNSIRNLNELRWLFAMKDCFFASFLFNANPSRRRSNQKRLGTEKQKQVLSFIYLKDFSFCAGDFLKLNSIDFQCFYLKQVLSFAVRVKKLLMQVDQIKVKINFYKSTILPCQVFIFNIKILNSYYQTTIDKNITNIAK